MELWGWMIEFDGSNSKGSRREPTARVRWNFVGPFSAPFVQQQSSQLHFSREFPMEIATLKFYTDMLGAFCLSQTYQ